MSMLSAIVLAAAGMTAAPPMSGHIVIGNGWFRALPAKLPAGGYFDLRNVGKQPVTLVHADSPACAMTMLHKSEQKNGVDSMSDVSSIDVPPGAGVSFAPGGYHLMCMDPGPTLKPGANVEVNFHFSDGSVATAHFPVHNASGQ
jgi:periplasmic copper chaperone A